MKIAIFGGSFDPIHTGHAMMANFLSGYPGIDRVWIMVSPRNPLKDNGPVADESARLDMARLVAEDCASVDACDFETGLPVPSYTIDTLRALRDAYPQHQFRWVIGSDNWEIMSRWRESESILHEFGVLVYERPGYPITGELPDGVEVVRNAPLALISSTFIRQSIKESKNINFFVPDKVLKYIEKHKLYQRQ